MGLIIVSVPAVVTSPRACWSEPCRGVACEDFFDDDEDGFAFVREDGELIRHLTINPTRDYQRRGAG